MSFSPPAATAHRQTSCCHECDMSVLLHPLSSSSDTTSVTIPPLCPRCCHDFLEHIDSFAPTISFFNPFPPLDSASTSPLPSAAVSDNNFLDSPYVHPFVHPLMTTGSPHRTSPTPPHYNSPASKSAIESLDRITIDLEFLKKDTSVVCPVCKDQFVIDSEAKVLPCKHMYHSDCIVPWLEINNSCPVCRYRLQSHDEIEIKADVRDNFIVLPRLGELLDDDYLFGVRNTLRNVVRRHQLNNNNINEDSIEQNRSRRVVVDNEFLFSPTGIEEARIGASDEVGRIGSHVERADRVETVSSWPMLPVEGGGSGDGEIDVGVSGKVDGVATSKVRHWTQK